MEQRASETARYPAATVRYRQKRAVIATWVIAGVRLEAERLADESGLTLSAWAALAVEAAIALANQPPVGSPEGTEA